MDLCEFEVNYLCNAMKEVGYSGTPLIQKLGIKPSMKVMLIHPPDNYFNLLKQDISGQISTKNERPDLIHLFVTSENDFIEEMKKLKSFIHPKIIIWVSWYKKSSGIATDITEDTIRNYALAHGLVDVKVCAVSESWSGLKLVVPVSKR